MISETSSLFRRFYSAPHYNCTNEFYNWIREYCSSNSLILNLGAGPATGNLFQLKKDEVAELVGADIDPIVLTNSEVHQAVVIENGRLPFGNDRFDVVYSDYVLEHVEKPVEFLSEVHRVLKPGASFFFRTPNLAHYVTITSYMTPHWFHELASSRARGRSKDEHEPYPTFYRLNTRRQVTRASREAGFRKEEFRMVEGHPSYLMFHAIPFMAGVAYERMVSSTDLLAGLRVNIFGKLTK